MAQTILNLPRTTLTMDEGRIVSWLVKVGDLVDQGSPVAELETDKAVIELEAPVTGRVAEILVPEDQVIPLGAPLAVFIEPDDEYHGLANAEGEGDQRSESPTRVGDRSPAMPSVPQDLKQPHGAVRASPAARRLGRLMGIDLATLSGTGPAGRILRRDIEASYLSPEVVPSRGPDVSETVSLSGMRRAIARNMTTAWLSAPQFALTRMVDMSGVLAIRQTLLRHFTMRHGRISVTDFVMQAVSAALIEHPLLNAGYDEGSGSYVLHANVGMGLAVAVGEDGLLVPVIAKADQKSLVELAQARLQ